MLRDLTIQNYRQFDAFSIDGLERVCLIVGANNSGKTSLLEAVYLLVNQRDPSSLGELLRNRGEVADYSNQRYMEEYQIAHIFHGRSQEPVAHVLPERAIHLISHSDQSLSLDMRLRVASVNTFAELRSPRVGFLLGEVDERELAYELSFVYQQGLQKVEISVPVTKDLSVQPRFLQAMPQLNPSRFITTSHLDSYALARRWDSIVLTAKEDAVIAALQILEPRIERISFTSRRTSHSGVMARVRGESNPVPLGSMGEGMRRVLSLAISVVMAENSTLLVDEIDTGLYYQVQERVWQFLIQTAMRLNVQIFATTHSWDCVAAFQEALSQQDNKEEVGRLFRLEERKGGIQAVAYDADDLAVAVRQAIEVR